MKTLTTAIAVTRCLAWTLPHIVNRMPTPAAHFVKWDHDALRANETRCVVLVFFSGDYDQRDHLHTLVIDSKDNLTT